MKKLRLLLLLGTGATLFLAGCNALEAFETSGSDQDKVELGEECLRDGDFTCAITAYSAIGDPSLKAEKLCAARLTQAGFDIAALVDTLIGNSGSASALGRLANALVTWTQARQDAADQAKQQCRAFRDAAPSTKQKRAILFKALAAFVHCATLVAKTDQLLTEDNVSCNVTGPKSGTITQNSITTDTTTGTVSAGNPGMCKEDVLSCIDDFAAVNSDASALSSQIPDIGKAYQNVPSQLKDTNTAADAGRLALRGTL